ncbi:hypothetical protein DRN73_07145 [Candidatus Pacearchaeota archaeon]|nr:MAG: hypothetical protein DRN73_07145 [Candidatus Pacearchaeota archaeon]
MLGKSLKLTCYTASAIEHNATVQERKSENYKELIKKELTHPDFGIYDPVEREQQKTGQNCQLANKYIKNLKRSGHWIEFDSAMDSIWWGDINPGYTKIEVMKAIRIDFLRYGNTIDDLNHFGDYQAVLRSNFIIAYLEKNVKTVGTIKEIHTAYLFNIPIYLLLPDDTISESNSTLVNMVRESKGEIFTGNNCTKDLIKYLKEKYKLWG